MNSSGTVQSSSGLNAQRLAMHRRRKRINSIALALSMAER